MSSAGNRPSDLHMVRSTRLFDESTVPAGLLAAHQIAAGVWGRVVVQSGSLTFAYEEGPEEPLQLHAGDSHDIPPLRPHRLAIASPVTFLIEFYK